MSLPITIHVEDISYDITDESEVSSWIADVVSKEGKELGEISIILCSDPYLHKMNTEYLQHDTYTDVITFDYSVEQIVSGDVFISLDRIKENAQTFESGFINELHRVIVHGILHLLGYIDKKPSDKAKMTQKEDFYLSLRAFVPKG
jgi:probable rRNA maturation factor